MNPMTSSTCLDAYRYHLQSKLSFPASTFATPPASSSVLFVARKRCLLSFLCIIFRCVFPFVLWRSAVYLVFMLNREIVRYVARSDVEHHVAFSFVV
jgi:hypothetical protein